MILCHWVGAGGDASDQGFGFVHDDIGDHVLDVLDVFVLAEMGMPFSSWRMVSLA